jgi:hypothetical protein
MARSDLTKFHREGLISDREYRRGGGICADEINDPEYHRDNVPGFGKTNEFGPDDAGHLDARANRRLFPKGTELKGKAQNTVPVGRSANTKGWPTDSQVRRMSACEWHPDWYSEGPTRQSGSGKVSAGKVTKGISHGLQLDN